MESFGDDTCSAITEFEKPVIPEVKKFVIPEDVIGKS